MASVTSPALAGPSPKSAGYRTRENIWGYLFLAPTLLLTVVFVIYPVIGSVRYTLYNWDGIGQPDQFVGLRHFIKVATDPFFWNAFKNTIVYTVVLVPVQLMLALILALVLNNPRLRFTNFYRALYFLPVVTSAAVVGIVMGMLFARMTSNFPPWMVKLGWVRPALGIVNDPRLVMPAIITIGIWHTLGYNLVYFLAALQTVPKELYEAATVDGAGPMERFWYITLPLIQPVGIIILFLAILGSLRVFDIVWVLNKGGPYFASDVVSTYIYGYAFTSDRGASSANYGYASAAAFFMSLMILGLTVVQLGAVGWARRKQAETSLK